LSAILPGDLEDKGKPPSQHLVHSFFAAPSARRAQAHHFG
jgi:hypothetical protein